MSASRTLSCSVACGVGILGCLLAPPSAESRGRSVPEPRVAAPPRPPSAAGPQTLKVHLLRGVAATHLLGRDALFPPGKAGGSAFALTPQGPLVMTVDNLYLSDSRRSLLTKNEPGISAFLLQRHGLLAVVAKSFGIVLKRVFVPKVTLPATGMRLAVGGAKGDVYLYGAAVNPARGSIYHYRPGAGARRIIQAQAPVRALVYGDGHVFFATGGDIYVHTPGRGQLRLFRCPAGKTVDSLAYDPKTGLLVFSSGQNIQGLWGPVLVDVARGIAGELRWQAGRLFVLDRVKGDLYVLSKVSGAVRALIPRRPVAKPSTP